MAYEPTYPGEDIAPAWLYEELQRIAAEMPRPSVLQLEVSTVEPARPQVGMIAYADGTSWNPGSGEGTYEYTTGGWRRLA